MKKLLLLTGNLFSILGIISILIFGLIVWNFSQGKYKLVKEVAPEWYCGTMDLPENKIFSIDHPGKILFEENCKTCHSIRKNEVKVGPSICGATERMNLKLFNLLLYADPNKKLISAKYYQNLKVNFNIDFHRNYKFNFDDSMKNKIRSFIDTITVRQK